MYNLLFTMQLQNAESQRTGKGFEHNSQKGLKFQLVLLLISHVSLTVLLNFSEPQFSYMLKGVNYIYLTGFL